MNHPTQARLKILTGPHKGASYKLVGAKVTIGRSKKNDIVLDKDERCSRRQALIVWENQKPSGGHYKIKDISKRSSLKINDNLQIHAGLKNGDILRCGNTDLEFVLLGAASPPAGGGISPLQPLMPAPLPLKAGQSAAVAPGGVPSLKGQPVAPPPSPGPAPVPAGFPPSYAAQARRGKHKKPPAKKNRKPKILMAVVLVAALYLYLSEEDSSAPGKVDKADKLFTSQDQEEQLKTLKDMKQKARKQYDKTKNKDYRNAQKAYIAGQRDYRKGVYVRAAQAFRACKTIYPQHRQCGIYLKKSQIKQQQMIQAWMNSGKSYRQNRRFLACMSSFKNVMQAVKNPKNPTFREARENYTICSFEQERGRY